MSFEQSLSVLLKKTEQRCQDKKREGARPSRSLLAGKNIFAAKRKRQPLWIHKGSRYVQLLDILMGIIYVHALTGVHPFNSVFLNEVNALRSCVVAGPYLI